MGLGLGLGYHGVVGGFLAVGQVWLFAPPVSAPRQDRLGCTIDPMIALRRANTLMHVLTVTNRVFRREIQVVG